MPPEVPSSLRDLIGQFVQTYSASFADLELDSTLEPKLWFMPLDSYEAKREAAHYFLLAAALSEYKLTGNPRNIRLLLHYLHKSLDQTLYTGQDPEVFKKAVFKFEQKHELLDRLGEVKAEIPEVICSVNRFIAQKANGDLIEYANGLNRRGHKPRDLVKQIAYSVNRMNKQHSPKAWLYLRWMTRSAPDLGLFEFDSKDLMVPLTTPKLRVFAALEFSRKEQLPFALNQKNRPDSWWEDTRDFDSDAETFTEFARSLFPSDPAKVDFPFFILGTWLEYSDLNQTTLEKALKFFVQKHQELQQPLMRFLNVVYHYNRIGELIEPGAFSAFERSIYDHLRCKQIIFNYEFMEFYLSKDNPALTYKPDFLLPRYTNRGRKIILEPHGVKENLNETLQKLTLFRQHYKEFFCLILIIPDDFIELINEIDPTAQSYDLLWKQSQYKIDLEKLPRS